MSNLQRLGSIAAFINAGAAAAALVVAFVLIGPAALSDPAKLADLAVHNPTPLIIQDLVKFVSAAAAVVLILALAARLRRDAPRLILTANVFGFLAVACLIANAVLSLYATLQGTAATGGQLLNLIGVLAIGALALNGIWYLLIDWTALKQQQLPKLLCYLGLVMGAVSLVPPLAIVVLLLSIVWSVWLGRVLASR